MCPEKAKFVKQLCCNRMFWLTLFLHMFIEEWIANDGTVLFVPLLEFSLSLAFYALCFLISLQICFIRSHTMTPFDAPEIQPF